VYSLSARWNKSDGYACWKGSKPILRLDVGINLLQEKKMAHTFEVTITDEEYRAFNLRVPDADEWVDHAVRNKVRKNMIWIAQEAILPGALDPADKAAIEAILVEEGDVMKAPKDFSDRAKKEMAKRIKMKTRVERDKDDGPTPVEPGS
jgi:hypothetical protein